MNRDGHKTGANAGIRGDSTRDNTRIRVVVGPCSVAIEPYVCDDVACSLKERRQRKGERGAKGEVHGSDEGWN